MHARVVLGVGKGVLLREVSSVPYTGVPLVDSTLACMFHMTHKLLFLW